MHSIIQAVHHNFYGEDSSYGEDLGDYDAPEFPQSLNLPQSLRHTVHYGFFCTTVLMRVTAWLADPAAVAPTRVARSARHGRGHKRAKAYAGK
jgi:hypothetical protein